MQRFHLYILLALLIQACSDSKTTFETPVSTNIDSTLTQPLSTLYVPITYEVRGIENLINQKLHGTFLKKKIEVEDRKAEFYLEITKTSRISIHWSAPRLYLRVPLKIAGSFTKKVIGLTLKNNDPVETEVILFMHSDLGFNPNWKLAPQTHLDSIQWITEPKLPVGFVEINLKNQLEKFIANNQEGLMLKLDEVLAELTNFDQTVQKLWTDIQKPIRINKKEKEVWLKILAKDMQAEFVRTPPSELSVIVRLKSYLFAGTDISRFVDMTTRIPSYRKSRIQNDSLDIYIHASVALREIQDFAHDHITGKTFEYGGYKVEIASVDLFGTDDKIIVSPKITGDVEAAIYLQGKPSFDQASKTLRIDTFNYQVETKNTLLSMTNNMLYQDIIDYLMPRLVMELNEELSMLPEIINNAIAHSNVGEKINLHFSALDVSLHNYYISQSDFQVILQVKGKADISLKDAVFQGRQ